MFKAPHRRPFVMRGILACCGLVAGPVGHAVFKAIKKGVEKRTQPFVCVRFSSVHASQNGDY
jgi:hypothetical protein